LKEAGTPNVKRRRSSNTHTFPDEEVVMKLLLSRKGPATALAFIVLAASALTTFAQIPTGSTAPPFELPSISSGEYFGSSELFSAHAHTFLIFWDSGCSHCVQSLMDCELFFLDRAGQDLAVYGIHADVGDMAGVYQLVQSNGITFPQLWDVGGGTARSYGAALAEFTIILVDRRGTITATELDPHGDMRSILEAMLSRRATSLEAAAAPADVTANQTSTSLAGLTIKGDLRTRFLAVESRGLGAQGPYGENITPGNDIQYRFELEISRRINRYLTVGGLLRISNEPGDVLEAGPKYLGSEWGSAYAEMSYKLFRLRAGYYKIAMTSLTLMRWDWNDNPRIGGQAGCGCGAQAGVLLLESLEELGPDLVFEGAVANYHYKELSLKAFYAIPRRANRTSYLQVRSTGAPEARYSLEIFGFESVWQKPDGRTGSAWQAGLHLLGSYENKNSVDRVALGYGAASPWSSSAILTGDVKIPVVRFVDLEGEWILANQNNTHDLLPASCCGKTTGRGSLAGIVFEHGPNLGLRGDYIRLESGFSTPFSALSYTANREGFRISGRAPLYRDIAVVALFYKQLKEIDPFQAGAEREENKLYGASLDIELPSGWGGSIGYMKDDGWHNSVLLKNDAIRKTFVAGAGFRFTKVSSARIEYQRIDGTTWSGALKQDYLTNLYSLYITARF
jgi:hypothetical protein